MNQIAFNSSMHSNVTSLYRQSILPTITRRDLWAVSTISEHRPVSLRQFDQIPMHNLDLLSQTQQIAPLLADQTVVFVGDHDSTSLLLGLLSSINRIKAPKKMVILDFDERLLVYAEALARYYGFDHILECQLYNVFDPVDISLSGQFDWFYTNPPYGSNNTGESARLFINRCCELVKPDGARGCIILPDDSLRSWTGKAMQRTQHFLCVHGWSIDAKLNQMHRYRLDDDADLASSLVLVKRYNNFVRTDSLMPYSHRHVAFHEIPKFYGKSVYPPYPRFIRHDGSFDFSWTRGN